MPAILLKILQYGKNIWTFVAAWLAEKGISVAIGLSIKFVVLGIWATFLTAFFSSALGLGINTIISESPFSSGIQGGIYLADAAFPINFAVGCAVGYITFRFTVMRAAMVMSRSIKVLFGA